MNLPVSISATSVDTCVCCAQPGTLECRTRSGTPTICGHSEYTATPSVPPKKYRVQTNTQDFQLCNGGEAQVCSGSAGSVGRTHVVVTTSSSTYSATTCGKTIAGTRTYGGDVGSSCVAYGGSLPSSDSSHCADCDMSGANPTVTGFTRTTFTTTSLIFQASNVCYFASPGNWGKIMSGDYTFGLSVEDTEADAITRFQAATAFGSWVTVGGGCSNPACCLAQYESRTSGFSFTYADAEWKATASGLTPSHAYDCHVDIYRRAYGSGSYVLYQTLVVGGTSDGSGNIEVTGDVPNDAGYDTYAESALFWSV